MTPTDLSKARGVSIDVLLDVMGEGGQGRMEERRPGEWDWEGTGTGKGEG
jgi:hypothetical protein